MFDFYIQKKIAAQGEFGHKVQLANMEQALVEKKTWSKGHEGGTVKRKHGIR